MGGGGTDRALGLEDNYKPVHWLHTILHGVRRQGRPTD
jgi:hypothetical protein